MLGGWVGEGGSASQMLCVSPSDFISNVLLTSGKHREEVKAGVVGLPFWRNPRINLSANDRRSRGKTPQFRSVSRAALRVGAHPAVCARSPSRLLLRLWQALGILGNRLVYSTFHHISC